MSNEEQQREAAQKEKQAQEARTQAKLDQETFERLSAHSKGEGQGEGKKQTGALHEHIERAGPRHHVGETPPEAKHGRSPADRAQSRAQEVDRAGEKAAPSEMKDWAAKGKEKEADLAQSQTASQTQENAKADDETRQHRR